MKRLILTAVVTVVVLCGCGENERRVEAYKRWYGTRAKALYGLAREHLRVGQLDKARNKAQEALALDAEFADAAVLLGKIYIEQGEYKLGAAQLEAVRDKYPESAEVVYLLAVAWEKQQRLEEALAGYRKAHALQRENFSCVTAGGEVLVAMGRVTEAQSYVEGYLSEAPDDPALHGLAGRLAMMNGDYTKAAGRFAKACEIDYKNVRYQESLGRAQFLAAQHSEALDTFRVLLSREGYEAPAWVHARMGDCYMALGRPSAARDAYYRVREMSGDSADAWADIGKAALALGDNIRATLAGRKALELDETHAEAMLVLGYSLLRSRQADEARRTMSASLDRFKTNATFLCLLGQACAAQGDNAAARRYYRSAADLEPDNDLPKTLLAGSTRRQGRRIP